MISFVFNLFSEFIETIGYNQKREAIKNNTASQAIGIRGYNEKNINTRDTYLSNIKMYLSNNHDACN